MAPIGLRLCLRMTDAATRVCDAEALFAAAAELYTEPVRTFITCEGTAADTRSWQRRIPSAILPYALLSMAILGIL